MEVQISIDLADADATPADADATPPDATPQVLIILSHRWQGQCFKVQWCYTFVKSSKKQWRWRAILKDDGKKLCIGVYGNEVEVERLVLVYIDIDHARVLFKYMEGSKLLKMKILWYIKISRLNREVIYYIKRGCNE